MRISDWSSDVCSSDLTTIGRCLALHCGPDRAHPADAPFRAGVTCCPSGRVRRRAEAGRPRTLLAVSSRSELCLSRHPGVAPPDMELSGVAELEYPVDRKSTRLNSSH